MTNVDRRYPDQLEIQPLTRPPNTTVRVPGSKSITNRALVLAALSAPGKGCELTGVLQSEDTEVMVQCLKDLGFTITADWDKSTILVVQDTFNSPIPATEANLYVANSGTTMRFLTAMVSLGHGRYRLDGVTRMRERPIEDLLIALRQLGVDATSENGDGYPPVIINTNGLRGGTITIKGDISSQFLSGLLMAAPLAQQDTTITVDETLVSRPYVIMTLDMMKAFGAVVESDLIRKFHVHSEMWYSGGKYAIEPDATAASYFLAAAAITRGSIQVSGLTLTSLQGDVGIAEVFSRMGCRVLDPDKCIGIQWRPLWSVSVDMNEISDTVMTLAAVACFASGPTTIRNVAHIRHKETDRLAALATELRRVGAGVEEFADGLTIIPQPLHGAEIETYNDHRMAMSMALIGLKVPGIIIKNPGCVAKTYPGFFDDLEKLRQ
jgi:3-phosphoshikimate 1-carboxyvinyltransferase